MPHSQKNYRSRRFTWVPTIVALLVALSTLPLVTAPAHAAEAVDPEEVAFHCKAAGGLEWAGLLVDAADAGSAVLYAACGEWLDAGLFVVGALIPLVPGSGVVIVKNVVVKVAKWVGGAAIWVARKAVDVVNYVGRKIGDWASKAWDRLRGGGKKATDASPGSIPVRKLKDLTKTTIINGFNFTINELTGLPQIVEGTTTKTLLKKDRPKSLLEQKDIDDIRNEVLEGSGKTEDGLDYHTAHMTPDAIGGPYSKENLFPQHPIANRTKQTVFDTPLSDLSAAGYNPRHRMTLVKDNYTDPVPRKTKHEIWATDPKTNESYYHTFELPNSSKADPTSVPPAPWLPILFPPVSSQEDDTEQSSSLSAETERGSVEDTSTSETDTTRIRPLGGFVSNAGSFLSRADAVEQAAYLTNKYERPFGIELATNGWWGVITGTPSTKEEALNTCRALNRPIPEECYELYLPQTVFKGVTSNVGSFLSRADAVEQAAYLTNKYERPFGIELATNGWWGVITGTHSTKEEALNTCRALNRPIPEECYELYLSQTT